jgi:hypothetical protein
MRTTLDLPDELLKRAKVAAIERGSTLRELVRVALTRELGMEPMEVRESSRATFPVFLSKRPGKLKLDRKVIAAIEADDDLRRSGLSR